MRGFRFIAQRGHLTVSSLEAVDLTRVRRDWVCLVVCGWSASRRRDESRTRHTESVRHKRFPAALGAAPTTMRTCALQDRAAGVSLRARALTGAALSVHFRETAGAARTTIDRRWSGGFFCVVAVGADLFIGCHDVLLSGVDGNSGLRPNAGKNARATSEKCRNSSGHSWLRPYENGADKLDHIAAV